MSSSPPARLFGCKQCYLLFPTLNRGITHLQSSAVHTALNLDLIEQFGGDYRDAAARVLSSFLESSAEEHTSAISDAKEAAFIRAARDARDASSTIKKKMTREMRGDGAYPESPVRAKRVRGDSSVVIDNSIRSQSARNRTITNVFVEPIMVRVTLPSRGASRNEYFRFKFARDRHDTVEKLLRAVGESYRAQKGAVLQDLAERGAARLMMKLSTKDGMAVGGKVGGDEDLVGLGSVQGTGWFGEMEIG